MPIIGNICISNINYVVITDNPTILVASDHNDSFLIHI